MRRRSPRRFAGQLVAALVAVAIVALVVSVPSAIGAPRSASQSNPKAAAKSQLQTFGIGPANANGLDRRGAFIYAGRPGTVVKDRFALVNYTTKPRAVRVYASDAFTTAEGVFDVLAADKSSKDIGSWVDLNARTVTIPARASATSVKPGTLIVPFTLKVPANASPGDHAGGFVVSVRNAAGEGTNSVVVDRRVGTRVYMQVAGARTARLEIDSLDARYSGTLNPTGTGTTRVEYLVENKGNVVLSARQRVVVSGWFASATPAVVQADLVQLLPGAVVKVAVDVPGTWPTIRPKATVTLVPYTGTAAAPTPLTPVVASTSFWAIPWALLTVLVALVLVFVAWRFSRRRRPDASPSDRVIPELVDAP